MKKNEKIANDLNEQFSNKLDAALQNEFGRNLETFFDIISMRKVSRPEDGKKFTKIQHAFTKGYSEGYAEAMRFCEFYKE